MWMTVSKYAQQMVEFLDDYAVGGKCVTPATESYQDLHHRRVALRSMDDWESMEAIHLNPAKKSLEAAYRSIHLSESLPGKFIDRAVVLDFDNYSKDGRLKVKRAVTPDSLLEQMRSMSVPLPFCYIESHTPGNFHFVWIYKFPKPRDGSMHYLRKVYSYWKADVKYTNSTMRNPVYMEQHHPGSVHWWHEWSEEPPLLNSLDQLLPIEFPEAVSSKFNSTSTHSIPSDKGRYNSGMSLSQLESQMRQARDGDGRWYLLKSWVSRKVTLKFQQSDSSFSIQEMWDVVNTGNEILLEPMDIRRVDIMARWWTSKRQGSYGRRQINAGLGNYAIMQKHKEAVIRYFDILEFKACLEAYREYSIELPEPYYSRDVQFSGRKRAPRGFTHDYIAHMLGVEDSEDIDPSTGEVLIKVTRESKIASSLRNGSNLKYSHAEFVSFVVIDNLTDTLQSVRLRTQLDELVTQSTIPTERLLNVSTNFPRKVNKGITSTRKGTSVEPTVLIPVFGSTVPATEDNTPGGYVRDPNNGRIYSHATFCH